MALRLDESFPCRFRCGSTISCGRWRQLPELLQRQGRAQRWETGGRQQSKPLLSTYSGRDGPAAILWLRQQPWWSPTAARLRRWNAGWGAGSARFLNERNTSTISDKTKPNGTDWGASSNTRNPQCLFAALGQRTVNGVETDTASHTIK